LESQRVKCLTEGYLRGWLSFNYLTDTSRLREEMVLDYIVEQRLAELLTAKLSVETTLTAGAAKKSEDMIDALFDMLNLLIEFKLPSASQRDKIEERKKNKQPSLRDSPDLKDPKDFTAEDIARLKGYLAEAKNSTDAVASKDKEK